MHGLLMHFTLKMRAKKTPLNHLTNEALLQTDKHELNNI